MTRATAARSAALLAALLVALPALACSNPGEPPSVARVDVTPAAPTLLVGPGGGQAVQLVATPRARNGKALMGRAVTWSSGAGSIATVSPTGLVTAAAVGTAPVSAVVDGITGTVAITVAPVPVATVAVTPPAPSLYETLTLQLAAEPRDSGGLALTGRTVTWGSSVTTVARVGPTGLVTGVAAGTAQVTATSDGRSGAVTLTVLAAAGPVLGTVSPAPLVPGTVVTLTGTGFDPVAGNNTLTLRGTPVPVLSAAAGALTFRVPCAASGPAALRVTTASGPGTTLTAPLAVTSRALGVGESVVLTAAAASECNELPATGADARFFVVAYSVATSANTLIDVELAGSGGASLAAMPTLVPAARAPRTIAGPVDGPDGGRDAARAAAREAAHARWLDRERERYEALRAEGAFRRRGPARGARLVAPPVVGEMRTLRYNFTSCTDSTSLIRARAIRVGTHAVVWEDSANTLQAATNLDLANAYQRLGEVFDHDQFTAVRTYFGDPLLRDSITDDDALLHMVFTQRLNGSGAAAYVTSCDQVPRTVRAASNFGEYFYGSVPTSATPNVNSTNSPDGWYAFMSRTVVHEVKHIAALASRAMRGAPFESSWLEEGTARHAEEVWVRDSLHRVPWKGNTGYGTADSHGIYCDFNLANATCITGDLLRRPTWGLRRQLNEILPKLQAPWDWSPYGDATGQSGAVFYNTTWSLVRWASDRYATSDSAFLRALVQSSAVGLANLAAATGATPEQLIGGWGLALVADDYPGVAALSADARFATWNLRDIYLGLHNDPLWASRYPSAYPVTTTALPFGAFVAPRDGLRGGAHAFFELAGVMSAPQLLHLRGLGGTALPASARLAIVRVR